MFERGRQERTRVANKPPGGERTEALTMHLLQESYEVDAVHMETEAKPPESRGFTQLS